MATVDDDDVVTLDLRDAVALLAERLDRDLTDLTLVDGGLLDEFSDSKTTITISHRYTEVVGS